VQEYIKSGTCLMAYLRKALNDPEAAPCGQCAVCRGEPLVPVHIERSLAVAAGQFLGRAEMVFKPTKQMASDTFRIYPFGRNLQPELRAEEGRILSCWGDAGWGKLVANDRHTGRFRDELVAAVAEMIQSRWQPTPTPEWMTCVPSLKRPDLVPGFARMLAERLGLPFHNVITKVRANEPQNMQQNRYHQCRNLDGVFAVKAGIPPGPVLLVDDIIDSGWTMTVLATLLRQGGSGPVFPVALASTSSRY